MSDPYHLTNRRITSGLIAAQLVLHPRAEWPAILQEAIERAPEYLVRRQRLEATMSRAISPHFSLGEFACHDGTPYPDGWVDERLRPLCALLETIRDACDGRRVTILSGYRTAAYNEGLRDADGSGTGVAKASQHIQGRAADIAVDGLAPSEVHATILVLYRAGRLRALGGLGLYRAWCHVDIREGDHLAQWTGAGVRVV